MCLYQQSCIGFKVMKSRKEAQFVVSLSPCSQHMLLCLPLAVRQIRLGSWLKVCEILPEKAFCPIDLLF